MSLNTFVTAWPLLLVLHFTGLEPLASPLSTLDNSALTVPLRLLILSFGVGLTSPLFMSIGFVFSSGSAVASKILVLQPEPIPWYAYFGIAATFIAFIFVVIYYFQRRND